MESATILDSNVDVNHSGGAILSNGGRVTITNSRLENNTGGSVGGLYLSGETADATITNSIFRNNRTTNDTFGLGGAITTWNSADVTIRNSTLEENQARAGGAIYNEFADTTIAIEADTKLNNNTATLDGGGIYNLLGTVTISNSTLSGSSAHFGGGAFTSGPLTVSNSTLSGNSSITGGSIYNSGGTLVVNNSTFSNNLVTIVFQVMFFQDHT